MDRLKMIVGCAAVIGLLSLAAAVALGHVEEKTSFGLSGIVVILGGFIGKFADWAYHLPKESKEITPQIDVQTQKEPRQLP